MQQVAADINNELEKLEPLLRQSLDSGVRQLRFPPELERFYHILTNANRRRRYLILAGVGMAAYNLFAICDWFVLPDIFWFAAAIRFLVVTPATLACAWMVHRRGGDALLDTMATTLLFLTLGSLFLFMTASHEPSAIHYHSGISLVFLFGNMVLRQPFFYALGVSLTGNVLYLLILPHVLVTPREAVLSSVMVMATSAISLVGNFQINYEHRREFLVSALQQIAGRKLLRMNSQLELLSLTDSLTVLPNRRQFDLTLQQEWNAAQRNRNPLTLIFLDVDHFKNYNDNYGHLAGDICLRRIGAVLTLVSKRAQDLAARYGGEEFVVLLPQTDLKQGHKLAEAIRQEVQALAIPHAYSEAACVVTVSLGVASLIPERGQHPDALVALADQALYVAKQEGRNRVMCVAKQEGRTRVIEA